MNAKDIALIKSLGGTAGGGETLPDHTTRPFPCSSLYQKNDGSLIWSSTPKVIIYNLGSSFNIVSSGSLEAKKPSGGDPQNLFFNERIIYVDATGSTTMIAKCIGMERSGTDTWKLVFLLPDQSGSIKQITVRGESVASWTAV